MEGDRETSPKRRKLYDEIEVMIPVSEDDSNNEFQQEQSNYQIQTNSDGGKHIRLQTRKAAQSQRETTAEDDSDELIEKLLRQAEENLSSQTNGDQRLVEPRATRNLDHLVPKSSFTITRKENRLLTDQLDDSLVVTAADRTVKPFAPPMSKKEKVQVIYPGLVIFGCSMMITSLMSEQLSG